MSFHAALSSGWPLALAWLLIGAFAAAAVRFFLLRIGLPLAKRTPTDLDEVILRRLANPLAGTLLILGAAQAWRAGLPGTEDILRRAVVSGFILVWGWALARLASHALLHISKRSAGESHARGAKLLGRFTKIAAAVIMGLTLLSLWDVSVTPLVASAGIAGIAIAFAAQETLANMIAGMAVYLDRIYEVGDIVVLDAGQSSELRGEVRDIGLRSTRILTRDDVFIIVPNSVIANGRVVNESALRGRYRIHLRLQVSYASDLDHVEKVLVRIGTSHPLLLPDPAPRARVRSFDDSGISVELLGWIADPVQRGATLHDLGKAVHRIFREEGIEIPFPQRVLHHASPPSGEA